MDTAGLRADYLEAVERYERAAADMRSAMDDAAGPLEVVRAHVAAGKPLAEVLSTVQPAGVRKSLSEAAEELERARHAAQRVVFAILIAEGFTMADVGRTFGISRSLVSRLLNEPGSDGRQQV